MIRLAVVALAGVSAAVVSACAAHRSRLVQDPGQDLIVLLPGADGSVGQATVSNAAGKVQLAEAGSAAVVAERQAPRAEGPLSKGDMDQMFRDVLSALPPAPQRFTLLFRFDSDELTDESRAMLPKVQQAVNSRRFPEVAVIGHTDTTGTSASNLQLGLKRAQMVRALLVASGLDPAMVEATSHGERDPIVPTADDIAEPRNRRVEISVR